MTSRAMHLQFLIPVATLTIAVAVFRGVILSGAHEEPLDTSGLFMACDLY